MSSVDKALETQLANIQERTGKSLAELKDILRDSNLTKHGEMVAMLKRDLSMGHGDANTVAHLYRNSATETSDSPNLESIYSDKKAHLLPIHEKLMKAISKFGDFEVSVKKSYVSLRRKKQFATIGPASQKRVEIGLNVKDLEPTERLKALPPGKMCQYRVDVLDEGEVDKELIHWIKAAFDAAG